MNIEISYLNTNDKKTNSFKCYKNKIDIELDASSNKKQLKKYILKVVKCRKLLNDDGVINLRIYNYNEQILIKEFIKLLKSAMEAKSKYELYEKAYLQACDYLDYYFYGKNVCDFCNNKCGYKPDFELDIGCCRHFDRRFGPLNPFAKLVPCDKLGEDKHCTIKAIGCKLFTCSYLNKKGIKFYPKDIFSLYAVFNLLQRILCILGIYVPQEVTLSKIRKVPNFRINFNIM